MLDEKGCQKCNKVPSWVSQRDRVIMKREKCEGIYNLKEENSIRDGVSGTSLGGSSSRGDVLRKKATKREPNQSVAGRKKKKHSGKARDNQRLQGERARVKGFTVWLQVRK